jgi:hypothetical protein
MLEMLCCEVRLVGRDERPVGGAGRPVLLSLVEAVRFCSLSRRERVGVRAPDSGSGRIVPAEHVER